MSYYQTPNDLAKKVFYYLKHKKGEQPNLIIIQHLFQSLFFCSMKTEESNFTKFHVVFINPKKYSDEFPPHRRDDYWQAIHLVKKIKLDIKSLTKLASATDERSSSIAVYYEKKSLYIWGLIDQANSYYEFISYETESGYSRPGLFQARILGIGHIAVYKDTKIIAELKQERMLTKMNSPCTSSPLLDILGLSMKQLAKTVYQQIDKNNVRPIPSINNKKLVSSWYRVLCRIILRMQNFGHGGAILITPDNHNYYLNLKYALQYERLYASLISVIKNEEEYWFHFKRWSTERDKQKANSDRLLLRSIVSKNHLDDSQQSLNAAIWFVALLSRADGVVILNRHLIVRSFGAEIITNKPPQHVYLAKDDKAKKIQRVDYQHFGTRHRSMMRYCWRRPGSIGIVVSQDGEIRIMSKIQSKLIIWENIRIQNLDFV